MPVSSASGSTDNGLSLGTVKRFCAAFLLVGILLPCIYMPVRQYPTYTRPSSQKTDYSIITVGREYHENAVTGIAAEHKTLTQTFTNPPIPSTSSAFTVPATIRKNGRTFLTSTFISSGC